MPTWPPLAWIAVSERGDDEITICDGVEARDD